MIKSESHLEEAQRIAHVGSWDWIAATDTPTWSRELCRILEVDPDKPVPSMADQGRLYTPDSMVRMRTSTEKAMQTGEPYEIELERVRDDGSRRWLLARGERWYNEQGEIIGLRGTALDITDRKQAEERLRKSEERFRNAMAATQDGLWEWNIEADDGYFSPGYYSMLGYEPDEFPPNAQEWRDRIHPEDIDRVIQANSDCIENKIQRFEIEFRMKNKAGEWRWILARGSANRRDPNGKALHMIGTHSDITHRKQAEEALKESEERLRTLVNTSPFPVAVADTADEKILYWSQSAQDLFGHTPRVVSEWYALAYPDPHYRQEVINRWKPYLEKARLSKTAVNTGEYHIVCRDGSVKICELYAKFIPGILIVTFNDITRRKQAEIKLKKYSENLEEMVEERTKELRNAQEALISKERLAVLGHFAGSISHELRNPLAAIDSSTYLLKMKLGNSDKKIDQHLKSIFRNVNKSTSIIQSLLNLARMEKPRAEKINLSDLISETLRSTKIPPNVETALNLPDRHPFVAVEAEQIRMALKNIIKNALQAMKDKGKLTISVQHIESDRIELSVSDTGPGIIPEHIEKVFEPLFSTKTHGIGFGLSIAKMIVENHGGMVRVESEAGSGTMFVINLPISQI